MRIQQVFLAAVAVLAAATMTTGAPGGGTVTGKVTYTGTPAKAKPIDMSKEPSCAAQHATPQLTESAVTGPGNTLEYVVVYISEGAPAESAPPSSPATFDQKGCHYSPHVLGIQIPILLVHVVRPQPHQLPRDRHRRLLQPFGRLPRRRPDPHRSDRDLRQLRVRPDRALTRTRQLRPRRRPARHRDGEPDGDQHR